MLQPFASQLQNVKPIKVKLTYIEANLVFEYIKEKAFKALEPNAHDELIVLAEYYLTFALLSKATRHQQAMPSKPREYSIPVSVVRILHRRWQQEPYHGLKQKVLGFFDYLLLQRGLRLDPREPEIFS